MVNESLLAVRERVPAGEPAGAVCLPAERVLEEVPEGVAERLRWEDPGEEAAEEEEEGLYENLPIRREKRRKEREAAEYDHFSVEIWRF